MNRTKSSSANKTRNFFTVVIIGTGLCLAQASLAATTVTTKFTKKTTAAATAEKEPAKKPTTVAATVALAQYAFVDPDQMVDAVALQRALTYFSKNQSQFENKRYFAVVDFTKISSSDRLFIVDLTTGEVESHLTTHGMGSDPNDTGFAKTFSNVVDSDQSSVGFYKTAEVYSGEHGTSMRLDGLSKTNSNARERAIVIHSADYVDESTDHAGRSDGCIAVDPNERDDVVNRLQGGAMIYAWANQK